MRSRPARPTRRAAVGTKRSDDRAHDLRQVAKIGDTRAILAVASSILTAIRHMPSRGSTHRDLGAGHFASREADTPNTARRLVNSLQAPGYKVQIEAAA